MTGLGVALAETYDAGSSGITCERRDAVRASSCAAASARRLLSSSTRWKICMRDASEMAQRRPPTRTCSRRSSAPPTGSSAACGASCALILSCCNKRACRSEANLWRWGAGSGRVRRRGHGARYTYTGARKTGDGEAASGGSPSGRRRCAAENLLEFGGAAEPETRACCDGHLGAEGRATTGTLAGRGLRRLQSGETGAMGRARVSLAARRRDAPRLDAQL